MGGGGEGGEGGQGERVEESSLQFCESASWVSWSSCRWSIAVAGFDSVSISLHVSFRRCLHSTDHQHPLIHSSTLTHPLIHSHPSTLTHPPNSIHSHPSTRILTLLTSNTLQYSPSYSPAYSPTTPTPRHFYQSRIFRGVATRSQRAVLPKQAVTRRQDSTSASHPIAIYGCGICQLAALNRLVVPPSRLSRLVCLVSSPSVPVCPFDRRLDIAIVLAASSNRPPVESSARRIVRPSSPATQPIPPRAPARPPPPPAANPNPPSPCARHQPNAQLPAPHPQQPRKIHVRLRNAPVDAVGALAPGVRLDRASL